ncbi:Na(+)/H(+) exchange regulatory cofactor NHE-RF3 isoform X1 [Xyrichtys novacula]|uniref:Na(+)/H(+) exchange regulatory cofactor NHE-RF3 isoform X1 n=1 Tax=Xyrichtys novacula TaxID=13765 RepID=A0AAV1H1M2_XYRNO|nr:Na(+)/H(+) exchange regulatory cofactor NHE-RF3 isoform X1 [Xyrichtys novacula]
MGGYKPRVISLTKKPGQTFGFYLRVEHGEEGHLIRCLEMGGPAELAGMKDGDRILRVNGAYVDGMSHSEVVDLVKNSGSSVTFQILDEASYKKAKAKGVNLSDPKGAPVSNGVSTHTEKPKPKLCYVTKSSSGFGFSLRSVTDERGFFMTEVIPGGAAFDAGVRVNDRLLEVNGADVDNLKHEQVVEKLKLVGNCVMLLLVDEETDTYYRNKRIKIGAWLATTRYLPHKPRKINITRGPDGYGFILRKESNQKEHYIKDIDRHSPAEAAGLQEMDRLVAINGKEVESCDHEQVVSRFKQSGNSCCLFVVEKETDQMCKLAGVSPMLFWEQMDDTNSPPSYTEAMSSPAQVRTPTPVQDPEILKPKLCRMEKEAAGYGFHLNGIQGVRGQYLREVVKGGVADRAGLEDDDIVVEVNGVNVENSSHDEVVQLIRRGGDSLEMLVAKKSVYDQLTAKGVAITRLLLGETLYAQVHKAHTPETSREEQYEVVRPETPPQPTRERTPSTRSSSSEASVDERF